MDEFISSPLGGTQTLEFKYWSAGPGSGKTTRAKNNYVPRVLKYGCNVVFVVPSIRLANQIAANSYGRIVALHSETASGDVCSMIQKTFEDCAPETAIVITEVSFQMCSHRLANKDRFVLIKDEAINPLNITTISVPDSLRMVEEWLNFETVSAQGCRDLLRALSFTTACPITSTVNDGITGEIHKLRCLVENPNVEVLVDVSRLNWKHPQLTYSAFSLPSLYAGFKEVLFMGANFHHTFLYHQWKSAGVRWADATPNALRVPLNSDRVRIHYWSEIGSWSRARRERLGELSGYVNWINARLGSDEYIFSVNNDEENQPEVLSLKGIKIPPVAHGLNEWRHITKYVLVGSYLVSQHEEPFFRRYGTSTADCRMMLSAQIIFQQLTRTDLRNRDSNKVIDVYVPTRTEALELLTYLPKASLVDCHKKENGDLTGTNGRLNPNWVHSESVSDALDLKDITPLYALGARVTSQFATCFSPTDITSACPSYPRSDASGQSDIDVDVEKGGGNIILGGVFSTQGSIDSPMKKTGIHPALYLISNLSEVSVTTGMTSDQVAAIKRERTPFFVTGIMGNGKAFRKENFVANNDIVAFDFDDSSLDIRDISRIFCGLELLWYTTISDTGPGGLRRFRVVVPCDRVMSLSEHSQLMKYWVGRIATYCREYKRICGLDTGCTGPERKFFLPHKQAEVKHLKRNKRLMSVSDVLSKIPRAALIPTPEISDIVFLQPSNQPHAPVSPKYQEILGIINTMTPGDRSVKAVRVGGMLLRYVPTEHHEQFFVLMEARGVSREAMKMARKYARRQGR